MALRFRCLKHQKKLVFKEIMIRLIKFIQTRCCEQFHMGTIFLTTPTKHMNEYKQACINSWTTGWLTKLATTLRNSWLAWFGWKKIVPTSNCSQQGLWVILSDRVTISGKSAMMLDRHLQSSSSAWKNLYLNCPFEWQFVWHSTDIS